MYALKKCLLNIKENKESFISSVISMIVVFILLNILVFGLFNLNSYKIESKKNSQIILYLTGLTENEKDEFQKKLLNVNGVLSLNYESKETALKAVSNRLGIDLEENENPLEDAFYVYIDDEVDMVQLKNKLESFDEVSELDLRTDAININRNFSHNIDRFVYISAGIIVLFGVVMMYHVSSSAVKVKARSIEKELEKGINKNKVKSIYFLESIVILIISYAIGYLIYYNIREFIILLITSKFNNFTYNSNNQELVVSLMLILISVLIFLFVNFVSLNKYYKSNVVEKTEEILPIYDEGEKDEN